MLVVRLLQKIGKEIMKRCEKHINVDRVFSGFIISTKKNIDESILCCEEWKAGYTELVSSLDHLAPHIPPTPGGQPRPTLQSEAPARGSRYLHTD